MRLLVPLDGSRLAEHALAHATALARSFEAELYLLQVIEKASSDPDIPFDALDWELRGAQSAAYLQTLKDTLAEQRPDVRCDVVEGDPPTEIIEFAKKHDIDLILLSAYGAGGVTRFPCGSTVYKVIARASVSLLLVRPEGVAARVHYRHILVPLDGSRRSDWTVRMAAAIASAQAAELILLQIIEEPKATQRVLASPEGKELADRLLEMNKLDVMHHLDEVKAQLPRELTVRCRVLIAPGVAPVVEEIAQAEEADLLVLNAHSVSVSDYWRYGPVTENVAPSSLPMLVFQDTLENYITLKPIKGEPARSPRVEERERAEAG